jgi:hypothetical protein
MRFVAPQLEANIGKASAACVVFVTETRVTPSPSKYLTKLHYQCAQKRLPLTAIDHKQKGET